MAFKVRPRRNGKFQATVEAPGFPPVSGTFPDEGSARSWAIATHTTVLSGGFLANTVRCLSTHVPMFGSRAASR